MKIESLQGQVNALEKVLPNYEAINPAVSKASVGWHISHALITMNVVIDVLGKSDPSKYKRTIEIRRFAVMLTGKIPRGKVKAPAPVRPGEDLYAEKLMEQIVQTRHNLGVLEGLKAGHFFEHPFLGHFKVKAAKRFLQIHTHHHLSIIRDILKK